MNGVMSPGVSAGSKRLGAGVKCSAHVICPAGASAACAGTPARANATYTSTSVAATIRRVDVIGAPLLDAEPLARLDAPYDLDELVAAGVPRHDRALGAQLLRQLRGLVRHELLLGLRRPLRAQRDHAEEVPVTAVAAIEVEEERVVRDR